MSTCKWLDGLGYLGVLEYKVPGFTTAVQLYLVTWVLLGRWKVSHVLHLYASTTAVREYYSCTDVLSGGLIVLSYCSCTMIGEWTRVHGGTRVQSTRVYYSCTAVPSCPDTFKDVKGLSCTTAVRGYYSCIAVLSCVIALQLYYDGCIRVPDSSTSTIIMRPINLSTQGVVDFNWRKERLLMLSSG